MFKTIIGFFKTGVSLSGISRWVIVSLVLVTFSLGMLLVITIGDRNLIQSNLQNAETNLKLKDKKIGEQEKKISTKETEISGCLGQVENLNKAIAEQQLAALDNDGKQNHAAEKEMDTLSGAIATDRELAATPLLTTIWMQNLFK